MPLCGILKPRKWPIGLNRYAVVGATRPARVCRKPAALSGLLLRDAWVGRGFHWEKAIDLHVPGDVTVSVVEGRLLLVASMPVEDYLLGVITSEMVGACPLEFLKAPCVVARSWTLAHAEHKHDDLGIDYCNDDCCQRFHGAGFCQLGALGMALSGAGHREILAHYFREATLHLFTRGAVV